MVSAVALSCTLESSPSYSSTAALIQVRDDLGFIVPPATRRSRRRRRVLKNQHDLAG
jgi:hypothetical protein